MTVQFIYKLLFSRVEKGRKKRKEGKKGNFPTCLGKVSVCPEKAWDGSGCSFPVPEVPINFIIC